MRCPVCRREYPAGTALCKSDGSPLLEPVAGTLTRGPVSLTQTVKIVDRVLDLLSGMHVAGKVHGNITPATVFFRHVGAILNVALTDLDEPGGALDARYQPPERLRGEGEDGRTDLYAVGALIFHMLRGQPPFPAGNEQQILNAKPPSMLDDTLQNIPDELDALVQQMLAKQPKDRPRTADEVRSRLENMDLDSTVMGVKLAAVKRVAKEVQAESMDALDGPTMEAMAPPLRTDAELYPDEDPSAFADTHLRIDRDKIFESFGGKPPVPPPKKTLVAAGENAPPVLVPPKRTATLEQKQTMVPEAITEAAPPPAKPPSKLPLPILIAAFVLVVAVTAAAAILLIH